MHINALAHLRLGYRIMNKVSAVLQWKEILQVVIYVVFYFCPCFLIGRGQCPYRTRADDLLHTIYLTKTALFNSHAVTRQKTRYSCNSEYFFTLADTRLHGTL